MLRKYPVPKTGQSLYARKGTGLTLDMEYSSIFNFCSVTSANLTKVYRMKEFFSSFFSSANIIERAKALIIIGLYLSASRRWLLVQPVFDHIISFTGQQSFGINPNRSLDRLVWYMMILWPICDKQSTRYETKGNTNPTTHKKPEDSLESSGFALLKEGGFLLSRIALQYHRRHWA